MKKELRDRIAENINRDSVLEFAAFTVINVSDLQDAANALFEKELYGQARSVAILALEELGKYAPTLGYLTDPASQPNFVDECFRHKSKQLRGHLMMTVASMLSELKLPEPQDSTELVQPSAFASIDAQLSNHKDRIIHAAEQKMSELNEIVEQTGGGEMEIQRQDGFYVSFAIDELNKISIKHPRLVTRDDAATVLKLLVVFRDQTLGSLFEKPVAAYTSGLDNEKVTLADAIVAIKKMIEDGVKQMQASAEFLPANKE